MKLFKIILTLLLVVLVSCTLATVNNNNIHHRINDLLDTKITPAGGNKGLKDQNQDTYDLIYSMIDRVIGYRYLPYFQLQLSNSSVSDNGEYFSLSTQSFSVDGEKNLTYVYLQANNAVNLAQAFNYYLKYYAMCSFTWTGDQCNLNDGALPEVPVPVIQPIASEWRYYMNVCTFGYSTVWWNWQRWQREIDWMAMNGYNLPLAFVGQEYVWLQVFSELGVSMEGIEDFFTGPAFLPWNRMGNVNGWGGLLDLDFIGRQRDLQLNILQLMRQYGMTPVLPGFAGHVPEAFLTLFPKANITQLAPWGIFNGTYFLDPTDPLFTNITQIFIKVQTSVYGTNHYYNFDPFNELLPPSNSTEYLRNSSVSMYNAMIQADPQAIWVLQGWFLVSDPEFWFPPQAQAFLSGIPIGRLLVLDLWAESFPAWNTTDQFYGHDWIWCMLHNFGGRTGMYGRVPTITTQPILARLASPGMKGIGLTPEAIEQNYMMYDMMSEMAWRTTPPNVTEWINLYTQRRYGVFVPQLAQAWNSLSTTVFSAPVGYYGPPACYVAMRPDLNFSNPLYYDPSIVQQAWQLYLGVTDEYVLSTATFSFDVSEITLQALSDLFTLTEMSMYEAYMANQSTVFEERATDCLNIITDMDTIAATQQMLLVGNWTAKARQWAVNSSSAATSLYEFNARNQITLWGPPNSSLHDYAYHLWSGLINDFYFARWALFIKYMDNSLSTNTTFNSTAYTNDIESLEEAWNLDTYQYPTNPTGNAYLLSKYINGQQPPPPPSSSSHDDRDDYEHGGWSSMDFKSTSWCDMSIPDIKSHLHYKRKLKIAQQQQQQNHHYKIIAM